MRFKIEITEIGMEEQVRGKEWKIGANPEGGRDQDYGYTPEIIQTVRFERKIYMQETDTLDLPVVILAFNGIADRIEE